MQNCRLKGIWIQSAVLRFLSITEFYILFQFILECWSLFNLIMCECIQIVFLIVVKHTDSRAHDVLRDWPHMQFLITISSTLQDNQMHNVQHSESLRCHAGKHHTSLSFQFIQKYPARDSNSDTSTAVNISREPPHLEINGTSWDFNIFITLIIVCYAQYP